ncbi:prepilin-type N-terminal cleavage/methylation domain-containing protein [Planctomycetota bacterium]|nr:prepilin-type N-terminal cleavage/methylation domain-containing protein [Planctomycetota bacterium]QQE12585.1 prepilin-type N-terminal cleavage/methylation domain-containing protein [Planctomycetota bacterium]
MRFFLQQDRLMKRRGFTLIEVLAALVLLSMLLVGIVSARSQYIRQSRVVAGKQNAIVAVDELLNAWWEDEKHVIEAGQWGHLIDEETVRLDWQIEPVYRVEEVPEELKMRVVRLKVVDKNQNDEVVLFVDLILSDLSVLQPPEVEAESSEGNQGGRDEA